VVDESKGKIKITGAKEVHADDQMSYTVPQGTDAHLSYAFDPCRTAPIVSITGYTPPHYHRTTLHCTPQDIKQHQTCPGGAVVAFQLHPSSHPHGLVAMNVAETEPKRAPSSRFHMESSTAGSGCAGMRKLLSFQACKTSNDARR